MCRSDLRYLRLLADLRRDERVHYAYALGGALEQRDAVLDDAGVNGLGADAQHARVGRRAAEDECPGRVECAGGELGKGFEGAAGIADVALEVGRHLRKSVS